MRWPVAIVVLGLAGSAACSAWSDSRLRESGPTPFARCLAGSAPPERSGRLGSVGFELRERVLTLTPERWPLRVAAFSGAGFGAPLRAADLTRLKQSAPDLLLLLGGLGDDDAAAQVNARSLVALGRLVLLVQGGRDRPAVTRAALEALGEQAGIIDATVLHRIVIANNTLVPVAGAEQGRYAMNEDACGFATRDLDALAHELGTPASSERRWLLSWAAPAGRGSLPTAALSETGVELGSQALARFRERIGALGGLSSWPIGRSEASPTGPLTTRVVPRLFGPRLERPDGTRAEPGVLVVEIDREGVRLADRVR
jgi:hypothetical protein